MWSHDNQHVWLAVRHKLELKGKSSTHTTHVHVFEELVQPLTGGQLSVIGEGEGGDVLGEVLAPGLDGRLAGVHTPVVLPILSGTTHTMVAVHRLK